MQEFVLNAKILTELQMASFRQEPKKINTGTKEIMSSEICYVVCLFVYLELLVEEKLAMEIM